MNLKYIFIIGVLLSLIFILITINRPTVPKTSFPTINDTNLIIATGKYAYKNQNSDTNTFFASNPTVKDSIRFVNRQSAISFFTNSRQSFATANSSTPTVSANTITYPHIFPDTDLRYTNTTSRLLEEFIVYSPTSAIKMTKIDQTVNLTNIDQYQQNNHQIDFYHQGQIVASVPRPVMYELNNKKKLSYGINYTINAITNTKLTVSKNIDQEGLNWLNDPKRNYPIVIDLVIDNADTASNWVSSNSTSLTVSQETTIKQEGTGSVKLVSTTPFGNGSDGSCTISSNFNINTGSCVGRSSADAVVYNSTVNTGVGSSSIILSAGATGISVGDEVLVIDMMGVGTTTNVGKYQFLTVSAVGQSLLTFGSTLTNAYYGGTDVVMVQRIPQYTNVTINTGITLTSNSWNNTTGGIIAFRVSGTTTNNGIIFATGIGYTTAVSDTTGYQGQSRPGSGSMTTVANDGGGGGGDSDGSICPASGIGAGGGGGYGSVGTGGSSNSPGVSGQGGKSYGSTTLSTIHLGSAGGTGTKCNGASAPCSSGNGKGANGGGIIFIGTQTMANAGTIIADGGYSNNTSTGGGGGSGSGGSIYINSIGVTLGTTSAIGGSVGGLICSGPAGGLGGDGRIRVEANTINGSSTPTASTGSTSYTSETATRTTSSTDLSTYPSLTFWIRSDHVGQYITFQFGETLSTENTFPVTINYANTWEKKSINISNISSTARDAVTKFAFKVGSVSSTVYFDDIRTNHSSNSPTLVSPSIGSTNVSQVPSFKMVATDTDSDDLQYKINLCTDSNLISNCTTINATNTGWSGADVGTSSFSSGTTATYVIPIGSSLALDTTYYWNSAAIDPAGSNNWSNYSSTSYFSTDTTPAAPTSCIVDQANYPASYTLRWSDLSTDEIGFEVFRKKNAIGSSLVSTTGVGITGYVDTDIQSGNTYNYLVRSKKTTVGNFTAYSNYCTSVLLNPNSGLFQFRGLKMEGLKIQ
ncbi:MAG: hypothetical protein WA067_00470 [Microgenomates group bacterium]